MVVWSFEESPDESRYNRQGVEEESERVEEERTEFVGEATCETGEREDDSMKTRTEICQQA